MVVLVAGFRVMLVIGRVQSNNPSLLRRHFASAIQAAKNGKSKTFFYVVESLLVGHSNQFMLGFKMLLFLCTIVNRDCNERGSLKLRIIT